MSPVGAPHRAPRHTEHHIPGKGPTIPTSPIRRGAAAVSAAIVAGAALAGCTTNDEGGLPVDWQAPAATADPAIAAMLPADIRDSGVLAVGTNTPYAPNEFKDSRGEIIGFDIDIITAVSQVLGLRADIGESDFEKIIPSIESGTLSAGISSMNVTEERTAVVDMAEYFMAGTQWATSADKDIDPDNACGLKVGVQRTTVQETEDVPKKSADCVARGLPPIERVSFDEQAQAANAVALGQVDAMSADSPVSAYAEVQSEGNIKVVGPLYDAAPYGISLPKGSPLGPAVVAALRKLYDDGEIERIAESWGVSDGLLDTPPGLA